MSKFSKWLSNANNFNYYSNHKELKKWDGNCNENCGPKPQKTQMLVLHQQIPQADVINKKNVWFHPPNFFGLSFRLYTV